MKRALAMSLLCVGTLGCPEPSTCRNATLMDVPDVVMSVVLSDYASSAIVLVREDGSNVVWVDSGSRAPGLVSALSGDVVLPSTQLTPHALVLLDRYQSDVMTVLPFEAPNSLLWQADLRGGRTAGTSPNPQDALALPDGRWLVSRFNPSVGDVPDMARGNDLVVMDPVAHSMVTRVDLHADVEVGGTHFFARPTRLAPLASHGHAYALVGLARLSDLSRRETGPGAIALVDSVGLTATVLELGGLSNCGAVAVNPAQTSEGFVLCQGDAFADDESRAGVVRVAIEDGVLVERGRLSIAEQPSMPAPGNGLVVIDSEHIAYVAHGALSPPSPDQLVMVTALAQCEVLAEAEAFTLGEGAYDARQARLLIPDGEMRSVRSFNLSRDVWREGPSHSMPLCVHLPPRQVTLVQ